MKDAYMKEIVRKACLRECKGKRTVSRELGIARNTLKRLLKDANPPVYRLEKPKPGTVIGRYMPFIEAWLKEDEQASKKQLYTDERIYERLKTEHGYTGSERRVR